jgi:hypothetical protein
VHIIGTIRAGFKWWAVTPAHVNAAVWREEMSQPEPDNGTDVSAGASRKWSTNIRQVSAGQRSLLACSEGCQLAINASPSGRS